MATLKNESVEIVGRAGARPSVFIGHGRSPLWARVQLFLENDLKIKTVSYESESRAGDSIVPILERMLSEATFAVLILTAEDATTEGAKRARQNVIHEAGLFQGRLGFKKAILLRQEGLEDFSNVAGLQYIPFSDDRIEQTFYELQRVLKRERLIL
jgi:predicted nucleotide-binding protein